MIRKTIRTTSLFLIWLVFILLLLQVAGYAYFRLMGVKAIGEYGYPLGLFAPHPELDYRYTPGFHGKFTGGSYFDIDISINELGFRDSPIAAKSSAKRIVVVGDSVVFGSGVHASDRFTDRLQESSWAKALPLQVLNMGVNSYTFAHYQSLAKLQFMNTQPDLVVVGFTLNDILPKDRAWPATKYSTVYTWDRHFRKRLDRTYAVRFVKELRTRITSALTSTDHTAYHTQWMQSVQTYWQQPANRKRLYAELDAFDRDMRGQGIGYLYLLFPERNDVNEPDRFSYARLTLVDYLNKHGYRLCDPYTVFRGERKHLNALYLPGDSVHFTPQGHQLLSDALSRCLRDNGFAL